MSLIQNPAGAHGYAGDDPSTQFALKATCYNGGAAAISEGDVVTLDATITASQYFHVKQADVSADDPATAIGVAYEAIAAGDTGLIVVLGYAEVNVGDSSSITAGQVAGFHATTDGAAANATADATTVSGDKFGVFLGAEDLVGTNKAPIWVSKM